MLSKVCELCKRKAKILSMTSEQEGFLRFDTHTHTQNKLQKKQFDEYQVLCSKVKKMHIS